MSKLILIKHAQPILDPAVPSRQWRLAEIGRKQSLQLARRLSEYAPDVIVASVEPKAAETGRIVAEQLGLPLETAPNLHEHERTTVPFHPSGQAFRAEVRHFFEKPDELVFGEETADRAHERFATAVDAVLTAHPGQTVAIVAHGTVITLYVAHLQNLEPYPFWRQFELADFVVRSSTGLILNSS